MLTAEDLAELRRLLADGTPGPWSTVSGAGNVWHFRDEGAPTVVAGHQCAAPRVPDALLIAAAVNALPALLDAAAFLDEVRAQVARGALCPMCSTGMARQTVGMVCQLCGTDYGSPDHA